MNKVMNETVDESNSYYSVKLSVITVVKACCPEKAKQIAFENFNLEDMEVDFCLKSDAYGWVSSHEGSE
jgi:hypothetical protein